MLSRDEMLIPSYPVISVDVYSDGSAHINVAGRHIDYPAAPLPDTRAAIVAYAATVAEELGRPVRMAATDHQGTFTVGVHPDGRVTDLTSEPAKIKRRRKPGPATREQPEAKNSAVLEDPAMSTQTFTPGLANARTDDHSDEDVPDERTRLVPATSARWAVLAFSTGQRFTVTDSALIGRQPAGQAGEQPHELIALDDPSRTVSKTHFLAGWHADSFWITDYESGNGTVLLRENHAARPLTPWETNELQHGDVLFLGDVRLRVTLFGSERVEGTR